MATGAAYIRHSTRQDTCVGDPSEWINKSSQHPMLMRRLHEATTRATGSAEQPAATAASSNDERPLHVLPFSASTSTRPHHPSQSTEQDITQPCPPFCIDLRAHPSGHAHADRPFYFDTFLHHFDWGKEIVLQVNEFYMVWLLDVDAAGFWYSLQDGTTFSLEVGDTTKKCKVRRGNDNVSWRWVGTTGQCCTACHLANQLCTCGSFNRAKAIWL